MVKDNVVNVANALSILRMLLGPVFMIAVFTQRFNVAFFVILFATITDFLDGQIARIWKMQTRVGKMLDAAADKAIIAFAVIALLIKFDFPGWIAALILGRDAILVLGGGIFLSKHREKVLVPNKVGKITTFIQMTTIVAFNLTLPKGVKGTLLILTAFFTGLSALIYFIKGYSLFFEQRKSRINLANRITILRIILIPLFILFLKSTLRYKEIVAAAIFIILASSDALDGYIARKRKQITSFGSLIDPVADKLLVSAALIFLIGKGIDAWMAFTIIAREFAITGVRMVSLSKNVVIPAQMSGKIKTLSQIIAIAGVLLNVPFAYWLMLAATLITLYSGIEYLWSARHIFREAA